MKVNRDQFMEDGYLVLREVVPPENLNALRESYELMVSRQREIWSKERGPNDPTGWAYGRLRHNRAYSLDAIRLQNALMRKQQALSRFGHMKTCKVPAANCSVRKMPVSQR